MLYEFENFLLSDDLPIRHAHGPLGCLGFCLESVLEAELGSNEEVQHRVEGQRRRESGRGLRHEIRCQRHRPCLQQNSCEDEAPLNVATTAP